MIENPEPSVTWLCGFLQASDAFYPTGSYAHSFGLEGLAQAGVVHDRETLRNFLLLSVLPALGRMELPLAVHAWRALAEPVDWSQVGEVSRLASASKTAREARLASENIGRQRAELLAKLRPHPLAIAYLENTDMNNWPCAVPISAALEGRVFGAPLAAILSGQFYSALAALLAAAMKLLRLGQNGCQTLLAEMLELAPPLIAGAEKVSFDKIGWFNPWLDIAAARHETAEARLFIS